MSTLDAIQREVTRLAEKIEAPLRYFPTYGRSEDAARPHIELSADGRMHWVVVERGLELERRSTLSRDDLLYCIFEAVTSEMASDYELRHRRHNEDFRRLLFTHELDLLGTLSLAWRSRRAAELGHLLREVGLDHLAP